MFFFLLLLQKMSSKFHEPEFFFQKIKLSAASHSGRQTAAFGFKSVLVFIWFRQASSEVFFCDDGGIFSSLFCCSRGW